MILESKRQELQDKLESQWENLKFDEKIMYVGLLSVYDLAVAVEDVSTQTRSIKKELKQLNLENWNQ